MSNVIDGTKRFKEATLMSLSDDRFNDLYTAIYCGAVKVTNRFMFKPQDLHLVLDVMIKRAIRKLYNAK